MSTENRSITVIVNRPASTQVPPDIAAASDLEPSNHLTYAPLIDIHESPDGLILEADLPGASEESLSIQLEENVLSLHARVRSPAPPDSRPVYQEYPVGDFSRSFILSDEVERSRITAELKNGVLKLTLPKAERAKTRRIEIKS